MSKFKTGDLVEVVENNKYRELHVGAIGKVRGTYENRVTVVFDSIHNPRSSYDCFYLNTSHIKHYEGDNIMEGNYRIATIRFMDEQNDTRVYRYALYDRSIKPDDICVVKSAHHGFGIARVISIEDKTDEKITREIVCKCDFGAYEVREHHRKRKEELKRKMAARAAALQEIALYRMMAAEDDSMAALMQEFEELEVF